MSTLWRTKPALQSYHIPLPIRSFQTFPSISNAARRAPSRAPRLVQKSKFAPRPSHALSQGELASDMNGEAALPPINLLRDGYQSGALNMPPERAYRVLRSYQQQAKQRPSPGWERMLCTELGISATDITLLGMISMRSPSRLTQHLGQRLLFSGSMLGDRRATFRVISSALAASALRDGSLEPILQHLALLVKEKDPHAMLLYGRVLEKQGREEEALKLFREASQSDFDDLGEALVRQSQILLKNNKHSIAIPLLRKAALELDHPRAFFLFSGLQAKDSAEYEAYLLKAASSGVSEAAGLLGLVEARKIMGHPKAPLKPNQRKEHIERQYPTERLSLAKEWFKIGATSNDLLSMLNLAIMCKWNGEEEEGLKWLEKAEQVSPSVSNQARNLRLKWNGAGVFDLYN